MDEVVKKSDLEMVLSGAAALQARELSHQALEELKGIAEVETDDLPISVVYEMAEDVLRLPREYVERYLQTRFPSREQQLKTINNLGARPTDYAIQQLYKRELIDSLKIASPSEEFQLINSLGYICDFVRVVRSEQIVDKGIFKKRKELVTNLSHELLARLNELRNNSAYQKFCLSLDIINPFFAEASKEKLEELKARFAPWLEHLIRHDYVA